MKRTKKMIPSVPASLLEIKTKFTNMGTEKNAHFSQKGTFQIPSTFTSP